MWVDFFQLVDSGEVSKIPETSREFDEVRLTSVKSVENWKNDMCETIFESD